MTTEISEEEKTLGAEEELEALRAENEALRARVAELEAELDAARLDFAVENELRGFGAKSSKAVRALLDMGAVELADGEAKGLKEQLEKLREEHGYLFAGKTPAVAAPTGKSRGGGFGFKFTGVR